MYIIKIMYIINITIKNIIIMHIVKIIKTLLKYTLSKQ